MRTFYIFRIKKELTILTKETPYTLYRTIENLYYLDNVSLGVSFNIYGSIFDKFNTYYINKRLNNIFKDNKYYTYNNEEHHIYNKYTNEDSILKVYKTHIILKTNYIKPTLLINYLMSDNLFVCDFKNKDYFWLNEFVR